MKAKGVDYPLFALGGTMPIPTPTTDDEGNADIGSCIRFLRRENPEMDSKQRVAICLNLWRKSTGKKRKS